MKRISFDERDAANIYEWFLAIRQELKTKEEKAFLKSCFQCAHIEKRLRNFLGKKYTKSLQEAVRKYPYF